MPMGSVLALSLALAMSAPEPGEGPDVPFRWDAPEVCPSAAQVRASVEAHLGLPLDALELPSWSVEGIVARGADESWTLDLTIEVPDGRTERSLHDPHDCGAVSDAAALLVALALDPEGVAASIDSAASSTDPVDTRADVAPSSPAAREATSSPAPERVVAATAEPPEGEPARASKPLHFVFGMAGGLDYGTLRGVGPIGRASFSWQRPRLRLGATATFGGTPLDVPAAAQEVSVWMWAAGVEAGPVFRMGAFEFPLMVGVEGGQLILRPRVLLPPAGHQVAWAAFLLTPGAAWLPRPWVALVLRAGATVAFVRPEFAIEGIGRIHAPARIGIRATLGIEFRIPLDVMKSAAGGNSPSSRARP